MSNIFSKPIRHEDDDLPQWKKDHPTWRFDHHAAGVKAMATNKSRYGLNFPEQIGRRGGKVSRGGGFARDHDFAVAMAHKSVELRRARKQRES